MHTNELRGSQMAQLENHQMLMEEYRSVIHYYLGASF